MSQTPNFRLNCDDYVLHHGDKPVAALLPEVAIVFSVDPEDGLWNRYKFGSPAGMHAWVAKQRHAQGESGGIADGLHVLEGKLPLADLNRAILDGSQVEALVKKCLALTDGNDYAANSLKIDGQRIRDTPNFLHTFLTPAPLEKKFERLDQPCDDVTDVEIKQRRPSP